MKIIRIQIMHVIQMNLDFNGDNANMQILIH